MKVDEGAIYQVSISISGEPPNTPETCCVGLGLDQSVLPKLQGTQLRRNAHIELAISRKAVIWVFAERVVQSGWNFSRAPASVGHCIEISFRKSYFCQTAMFQIRPCQPGTPVKPSNAASLEMSGQVNSRAVAAIIRSKGSRCAQSSAPAAMAMRAV